MKDQLISFETAKLAKKKGLINGIEVEYVYDIGWGKFKSTTDKPISSKTEEGLNYKRTTVKNQFHLALAPTQSLLQKWLRDTFKLWVWVEPDKFNKKGLCTYYIESEDESIVIDEFAKPTYKTWRMANKDHYEALEKGLLEALRLIKI